MADNTNNAPHLIGIAAVERDTGLSKDTLRIWERRYGFPLPLRDANDERLYPLQQVEKLRLLRRLMDSGHRPGKIVPKSVDELDQLAAELVSRQPTASSHHAASGETDNFLKLLRAHQTDAFRQALSAALMRDGVEQFVMRVVAPLAAAIGEAWVRGELEIFEEHLFTEQVSQLLRNAINGIAGAYPGQPAHEVRPRVLLTTFPQEPHGLGLLMAETLLALNGCACISLGVQTPVPDIALAAAAHKVDVVALSFSPVMNSVHVVDGLAELQARLPAGIEIWAGGSCPALTRRALRDVRKLQHLEAIGTTVNDWRNRRQQRH